jgi:hypothetical protein
VQAIVKHRSAGTHSAAQNFARSCSVSVRWPQRLYVTGGGGGGGQSERSAELTGHLHLVQGLTKKARTAAPLPRKNGT